MKNPKPIILILLSMILLSACSDGSIPQPAASATPEVNATTLQAALPTSIGSPDPSGAALSPVFDLTRTEDNPITDAQHIIEILETLEGIERSQPVPPGWYLKSSNELASLDDQGVGYIIYHVIDGDLNCDLAMDFLLGPGGNFLGLMVRDYGTPIWSNPFRGPVVRMDDGSSFICNLSNPNLYWLTFYRNYSETFSDFVERWQEPGVEQWGNYSFSAWFEGEKDQPVFVLQEISDNMRSAYTTDPDTKVLTEMRSNVEKRTFSLDNGWLMNSQSTTTLVNNKVKQEQTYYQMVYYHEKAELPPSVLAFLEESLQKYDEMQLP